MSDAPCFYPNGNPSLEDDIPCGPGSAVACCPLNWVCQANGLCYLENEDYYGRYTCTDETWGPGCPDICTYNNTAKGNEAVLECTTGSYCCDTNRPELSGGTDCCDASPSRFSINGNAEILSTSESLAQSPSFVPVSAPASSTSTQTSTTAAATAISLSCNSGLGEASCGSICCAGVQYCAYAGQCSASTSTTESRSLSCNSGLGEASCGSICCASVQYCAYAGQCSASSSTTGSSSGASTLESPVTATTTTTTTSSSNSIRKVAGSTAITPSSSSQSAPLTTSSATSSFSPRSSSSIELNTATTTAVTSTAAVPPTAAPSPSVTHSTGFKAGVPVGAAVFLIIILLALFCWRRRRRTSPKMSAPENPSNMELPKVALYGETKPPDPNPYRQPFPIDPSLNDERHPANSRSRSNFSLVPDHDPGNHLPRLNLQHAPPLSPYAVPPAATAAGAAFGAQEHSPIMSPAPSYTTDDPAGRAQMPQSSQLLTPRGPAIQEVPGDDRFGK